MKGIRWVSMICRPGVVRQVASEHSAIAAVVVNAVNGVAIVPAVAIWCPLPLTGSVVVLLALLLGPLAGFSVPSIYVRIERAVGNYLGGKASLDYLYRLLAWSFLPLALAMLFYSLIPSKETGTVVNILVSIPFLGIAACSVSNYWYNVFEAQGVTRTRAAVGIMITLIVFVVVVVASAGVLALLFSYGISEDMKALIVMY